MPLFFDSSIKQAYLAEIEDKGIESVHQSFSLNGTTFQINLVSNCSDAIRKYEVKAAIFHLESENAVPKPKNILSLLTDKKDCWKIKKIVNNIKVQSEAAHKNNNRNLHLATQDATHRAENLRLEAQITTVLRGEAQNTHLYSPEVKADSEALTNITNEVQQNNEILEEKDPGYLDFLNHTTTMMASAIFITYLAWQVNTSLSSYLYDY